MKCVLSILCIKFDRARTQQRDHGAQNTIKLVDPVHLASSLAEAYE